MNQRHSSEDAATRARDGHVTRSQSRPRPHVIRRTSILAPTPAAKCAVRLRRGSARQTCRRWHGVSGESRRPRIHQRRAFGRCNGRAFWGAVPNARMTPVVDAMDPADAARSSSAGIREHAAVYLPRGSADRRHRRTPLPRRCRRLRPLGTRDPRTPARTQRGPTRYDDRNPKHRTPDAQSSRRSHVGGSWTRTSSSSGPSP